MRNVTCPRCGEDVPNESDRLRACLRWAIERIERTVAESRLKEVSEYRIAKYLLSEDWEQETKP